jgi:NAD-dependent dihydropyrimidine dehydrogenase PreA subunit
MQLKYRDILYNDDPIGPYPTHLLKRLDKPTNRVPGTIGRVDARDSVFGKSFLGEFGEEIQREFMRMTVRYPVGGALTDLQHHINTYKAAENPVAAKKAPIPDDPRVLSRHIKCLGHFLGADIVGIGRLPQSAVYTHDMMGNSIEAPFKYAVCLMCRKHVPTLSASNGWEEIVDPASFQAYQRLALQTEVMANYIRRLGHEAEATNAYTYLTLMPEIVLACGLGEVSRMGIILNPFLGTNCKTAAVLTNLELEADGYIDFGLQKYCEECADCADQCPSRAITRGKQTLHNGYYTWKLNARACNDFDVLNKEGCVCGRCTSVCPWNRPQMDGRDFAGWDGNLEWLHRTVDEQRERNAANDFVDPAERTQKWWFELDEVDGELVIPTGRNEQKICREYPLQR